MLRRENDGNDTLLFPERSSSRTFSLCETNAPRRGSSHFSKASISDFDAFTPHYIRVYRISNSYYFACRLFRFFTNAFISAIFDLLGLIENHCFASGLVANSR